MRLAVRSYHGSIRAMPAKKLAISLEGKLAKQVERAAKSESQGNISAWLADAARLRLRQLAAKEALRAYEAESGPITDDELDEVRRLWPRG
jgi:hypothetical protein